VPTWERYSGLLPAWLLMALQTKHKDRILHFQIQAGEEEKEE